MVDDYDGAMRARLILVPLDLRMSADAIAGIVAKSGAKRLFLGGGKDAPDAGAAGLRHFPTSAVEDVAAAVDAAGGGLPADWGAQVEAWPRAQPADIFELIFT